MRPKAAAVILIGLALSFAVLGLFWNVVRSVSTEPAASQTAAAAPLRHLDAPEIMTIDQSLGPKDAPVTIVEFGDYLCEHCRASEDAVEQLLAAQPKRIRYVWKDMPSPLHPGADVAAQGALCAGKQGKFWEFHRALMAAQGSIDQTSLTFQASQLNLDTQAFADCLTTQETAPFVERTTNEGLALGIDGLPTFYVNGKRYDGAMTYDELSQAAK